MKKRLFVLSSVVMLVLLMTGVGAAEKLIFSESFENNTVGENPVEWDLVHPKAGIVVDGNTISIPDGKLALQLNNTPNDMGEVSHEIPEVTLGKLVVNFHQPSVSRENINIEVHNADGRIVGIFVTGSGNVRVRDAGEQSSNILNLPNDKWHTMIIKWDEELFKVYYLDGAGAEVAITETAKLDPEFAGKPANKILFNVSKRDDAKEAFIDNIRVYDLAD